MIRAARVTALAASRLPWLLFMLVALVVSTAGVESYLGWRGRREDE